MIKVISTVFVLLSVIVSGYCQAEKQPQLEISNGLLRANLYLPDYETGYYKGTRFDWSGIISSLEYKGHSYFDQWFDTGNPPPFATIMGPVEAYAPLNYDTAEVGGDFVKIGIGALRKESNEPYSDFKTYTIVDKGIRTLKTKANEVQFVHVLNTETYSYEYTKTIQFVENESKMVISHSLKNTGEQAIKTFGFNHNFFVIDNQPIGKAFELSFPVEVSGTGRGMGDSFEIQGKKIIFTRDLVGDESIACKHLEGLNNSIENFDIRLDNTQTGAGVKITGDQPLSRLRLWGTTATLCPETYIDIHVAPGDTFHWNYFYEFYEMPTSN
ncbi:hypothetical protein [Mariniflexile sp. AS56]|uniref:hypothetical protein n=1 Tax=Mariniflexile sp. AS56 TaxID=3063957 RepID=UPI0026EAD079|nr:hypothetical protein [Mariniflexile sp. AS56]MDO7171620.1 hypothetical protein [Mariniflexile sp. AS56]